GHQERPAGSGPSIGGVTARRRLTSYRLSQAGGAEWGLGELIRQLGAEARQVGAARRTFHEIRQERLLLNSLQPAAEGLPRSFEARPQDLKHLLYTGLPPATRFAARFPACLPARFDLLQKRGLDHDSAPTQNCQ